MCKKKVWSVVDVFNAKVYFSFFYMWNIAFMQMDWKTTVASLSI